MTIDWDAVQEHLDYLHLDPEESPILFRAWCKDFGRDFLKNGKSISGAVDKLMAQRFDMSLGFVVNPGGGKKADITSAIALFTEDDSGASIDDQMVSWRGVMPKPGLSVFSGNKSIHHYWPLREPITPEQFTIAQRRLAAVMQAANPGGDADTSLDDPNQVMRVAGAIHPKTGNRAEIRHRSIEQFTLVELEEWFTAAEARFNIQPRTTAAPNRRRITVAAISTGDGTHYKDLTASQRHAVVIDALGHCPQRGKRGDGGYPLAQRILAALVHEFGREVACDLAAQANWSQDSDWDIDKVAISLEADPPEAGKRSKIWTVFSIAAEDPEDPENPWICPWQEQSSPLKPDPTSLSAITVDANGDTPGDEALIDQWGSGWQVTDMGKRIRTNLCTGDALTSLEDKLPERFLRFNTVTRLPEAGGHPISESEMERLYGKAQQAGWNISKTSCIDAVYSRATACKFDPIQDYLNVVAADPQLEAADINTLSTTYLGTTEPMFDRYLKVGLIGAVKRRFEPGCKFDTVVTLDGDGGIYKSEFWIVLASSAWHSSSDAEQDKDFLLISTGHGSMSRPNWITSPPRKRSGNSRTSLPPAVMTCAFPSARALKSKIVPESWWAPLMAPFFVVILHSAAGSSSSNARNHLMPANASTSSRCAVIAMPSGKPLFWPIGQGNHASSIQRPRQQPARSICKTLRTNTPGRDQSPLGCINPSIWRDHTIQTTSFMALGLFPLASHPKGHTKQNCPRPWNRSVGGRKTATQPDTTG